MLHLSSIMNLACKIWTKKYEFRAYLNLSFFSSKAYQKLKTGPLDKMTQFWNLTSVLNSNVHDQHPNNIKVIAYKSQNATAFKQRRGIPVKFGWYCVSGINDENLHVTK